MKKRLAALIDVKSIVTIMLTAAFCAMTAVGKITSEQFMTIFATVVAFYFGTQHQKNCDSTHTDDLSQGSEGGE